MELYKDAASEDISGKPASETAWENNLKEQSL